MRHLKFLLVLLSLVGTHGDDKRSISQDEHSMDNEHIDEISSRLNVEGEQRKRTNKDDDLDVDHDHEKKKPWVGVTSETESITPEAHEHQVDS